MTSTREILWLKATFVLSASTERMQNEYSRLNAQSIFIQETSIFRIMSFITFNPLYALKPDEGKTLIVSMMPGRGLLENDSFTNIIHPIYAMILSFADGREASVCIKDAAEYLKVDNALVENFINSLTDNPNEVVMKSKDGMSVFPPYTIVTSKSESATRRYDSSLFDYEKISLHMDRYKEPGVLTLMVNNICVTDCVYCYEDKSCRKDCSIPLPRILELIDEAKRLHVTTFDVVGGEFFLYPNWKEVLGALRHKGYQPYLSTKMPLTEEMVKTLKDLNIFDLQVSLDSLIDEHLVSSLKVKAGYADKMRKSLQLLNSYHIPVRIHSVLTRYNGHIEDLHSLYEVLKNLNNITDWKVVVGDSTLYPRVPYETIAIDNASLNEMADFLDKLSNSSPFPIHGPARHNSSLDVAKIQKKKVTTKSEKAFFSRSFCSGLFSSLYILPDGNVTICEQLYWHPRFIMGNIKDLSLEEIWNSDKARQLYNITQADISADSQCHDCAKFVQCRHLRQVCYRDIIKKYGREHWYYPDAHCPFA